MANSPGTPIWFELNTPDQQAAQDFYAAVTGWTIAPSPMAEHGGYLLANAADGQSVAGIMTPPPGAPAFDGWSIYFASHDVDGDAERVKALGGAIHFGPINIPGVGRFAVAADPQGVVFFLMKGASPEDSQAFRQGNDASNHGHGVWIELASPDPDGAFAFYGALFGWTKEGAMPMGDMGEYAFIGTADAKQCDAGELTAIGAIMSSDLTKAPARWSWYAYVPDIDAAADSIKANGGTVFQDPTEIPGGDYSLNASDPQGAGFGLVGPRK